MLVRQYLDPDFIFGGHALVYSYIPSGELWLDALQDPREAPYHLLHERTEYTLMRKGVPYDSAHDLATAADKAERRKDGIGRYPGDAHAR
ncbi:MAG: hypothetical protein HY341_02290 [Candidatus Kerfeldbacteria bacterium]|nr:hypothetical protein [Candidatus Kerfeldbacteria bacterium]